MSKFGWSYPPGCEGVPADYEDDAEDYKMDERNEATREASSLGRGRWVHVTPISPSPGTRAGEPWALWPIDEAPDELRRLFRHANLAGSAIVAVPRYYKDFAESLFFEMALAQSTVGDHVVYMLSTSRAA